MSGGQGLHLSSLIFIHSDGGKQYDDASFGKILTVMMISMLLARVVGITPVLSYIHPRAVEETMYSILTLILRLMLTLIIDVNIDH